MRLFLVFMLFNCLGAYAQNRDTVRLEVPKLIEISEREELIFKVNWDRSYTLEWESDIDSLNFDFQEGEFYLSKALVSKGLFTVEYSLTDTLNNIVNSASTVVKVSEKRDEPRITLRPDSLINNSFIELAQGKSYMLEFTASGQNTRNENVLLSYIVDKNPNIKAFDNAQINIINNRLMLNWEPTQEQVNHKYYDLEIIAIDSRNTVSRSVFHFKILDSNIMPTFRFDLNNNYVLTGERALEIDFSVNDPDGEDYQYAVKGLENFEGYSITQEGKFIWQISSRKLSRFADSFPLNVKLSAQNERDADQFLEKEINISLSLNNSPPVITKLSNLSVREGYALKRRVFFKDSNHALSELDFILENEPDWLYLQQEGDAVYLMSDTLGFDIVKADGIPVQYDVLLTVKDPESASDNKFFSVTVSRGVNAQKVFYDYEGYLDVSDVLLSGLRKKIVELDNRLQRNSKLKKAFLLSSIFLGGFSAVGSFFDEQTIANQAVPFTGAALAISSSVNALAFNQEGQITTTKVKLEALEKELIRNRSYLLIYDIKDPTDEQLKNPELVDRVKTYRQQLIEQKIELENLEKNYRELNYVKKEIKKNQRRGERDALKWRFIN